MTRSVATSCIDFLRASRLQGKMRKKQPHVSWNNEDPIEGPRSTPLYHSLEMFGGFQEGFNWALYDAERRQPPRQLHGRSQISRREIQSENGGRKNVFVATKY